MSTTLVILLILVIILVIAVLFVVARRRGRAGGVLAQKPRSTGGRPSNEKPGPDDRSDVA
jgi:hypothetical protein